MTSDKSDTKIALDDGEKEFIQVTSKMIEAGVDELRDFRIGGDLKNLAHEVFLMMALNSPQFSPDSQRKPNQE